MEKALTYSLAGIGLVKGLNEVYVRPHLTAKRGWKMIWLAVSAYELACPEDELLSQGVDKALEKHPVLTLGAITLTACHLANVIPEKYDPFSIGIKAVRRGARA